MSLAWDEGVGGRGWWVWLNVVCCYVQRRVASTGDFGRETALTKKSGQNSKNEVISH